MAKSQERQSLRAINMPIFESSRGRHLSADDTIALRRADSSMTSGWVHAGGGQALMSIRDCARNNVMIASTAEIDALSEHSSLRSSNMSELLRITAEIDNLSDGGSLYSFNEKIKSSLQNDSDDDEHVGINKWSAMSNLADLSAHDSFASSNSNASDDTVVTQPYPKKALLGKRVTKSSYQESLPCGKGVNEYLTLPNESFLMQARQKMDKLKRSISLKRSTSLIEDNDLANTSTGSRLECTASVPDLTESASKGANESFLNEARAKFENFKQVRRTSKKLSKHQSFERLDESRNEPHYEIKHAGSVDSVLHFNRSVGPGDTENHDLPSITKRGKGVGIKPSTHTSQFNGNGSTESGVHSQQSLSTTTVGNMVKSPSATNGSDPDDPASKNVKLVVAPKRKPVDQSLVAGCRGNVARLRELLSGKLLTGGCNQTDDQTDPVQNASPPTAQCSPQSVTNGNDEIVPAKRIKGPVGQIGNKNPKLVDMLSKLNKELKMKGSSVLRHVEDQPGPGHGPSSSEDPRDPKWVNRVQNLNTEFLNVFKDKIYNDDSSGTDTSPTDFRDDLKRVDPTWQKKVTSLNAEFLGKFGNVSGTSPNTEKCVPPMTMNDCETRADNDQISTSLEMEQGEKHEQVLPNITVNSPEMTDDENITISPYYSIPRTRQRAPVNIEQNQVPITYSDENDVHQHEGSPDITQPYDSVEYFDKQHTPELSPPADTYCRQIIYEDITVSPYYSLPPRTTIGSPSADNTSVECTPQRVSHPIINDKDVTVSLYYSLNRTKKSPLISDNDIVNQKDHLSVADCLPYYARCSSSQQVEQAPTRCVDEEESANVTYVSQSYSRSRVPGITQIPVTHFTVCEPQSHVASPTGDGTAWTGNDVTSNTLPKQRSPRTNTLPKQRSPRTNASVVNVKERHQPIYGYLVQPHPNQYHSLPRSHKSPKTVLVTDKDKAWLREQVHADEAEQRRITEPGMRPNKIAGKGDHHVSPNSGLTDNVFYINGEDIQECRNVTSNNDTLHDRNAQASVTGTFDANMKERAEDSRSKNTKNDENIYISMSYQAEPYRDRATKEFRGNNSAVVHASDIVKKSSNCDVNQIPPPPEFSDISLEVSVGPHLAQTPDRTLVLTETNGIHDIMPSARKIKKEEKLVQKYSKVTTKSNGISESDNITRTKRTLNGKELTGGYQRETMTNGHNVDDNWILTPQRTEPHRLKVPGAADKPNDPQWVNRLDNLNQELHAKEKAAGGLPGGLRNAHSDTKVTRNGTPRSDLELSWQSDTTVNSGTGFGRTIADSQGPHTHIEEKEFHKFTKEETTIMPSPRGVRMSADEGPLYALPRRTRNRPQTAEIVYPTQTRQQLTSDSGYEHSPTDDDVVIDLRRPKSLELRLDDAHRRRTEEVSVTEPYISPPRINTPDRYHETTRTESYINTSTPKSVRDPGRNLTPQTPPRTPSGDYYVARTELSPYNEPQSPIHYSEFTIPREVLPPLQSEPSPQNRIYHGELYVNRDDLLSPHSGAGTEGSSRDYQISSNRSTTSDNSTYIPTQSVQRHDPTYVGKIHVYEETEPAPPEVVHTAPPTYNSMPRSEHSESTLRSTASTDTDHVYSTIRHQPVEPKPTVVEIKPKEPPQHRTKTAEVRRQTSDVTDSERPNDTLYTSKVYITGGDNQGETTDVTTRRTMEFEDELDAGPDVKEADLDVEHKEFTTETGQVLIKNAVDTTKAPRLVDIDDEDNTNVFDQEFFCTRENPLYRSNEDLRESKEEVSRTETWTENTRVDQRKDESIDDVLQQVLKIGGGDQYYYEYGGSLSTDNKGLPKPNLRLHERRDGDRQTFEEWEEEWRARVQTEKHSKKFLRMRPITETIRSTIKVDRNEEEVYGGMLLHHADGTNYQAEKETLNFDTIQETIDLGIHDGVAEIAVRVICERVVPVNLETNIWKKSSVVVTRLIQFDLEGSEETRDIYRRLIYAPGTRHRRIEFQDANGVRHKEVRAERELGSGETLQVFTDLMGVAGERQLKKEFSRHQKYLDDRGSGSRMATTSSGMSGSGSNTTRGTSVRVNGNSHMGPQSTSYSQGRTSMTSSGGGGSVKTSSGRGPTVTSSRRHESSMVSSSGGGGNMSSSGMRRGTSPSSQRMSYSSPVYGSSSGHFEGGSESHRRSTQAQRPDFLY